MSLLDQLAPARWWDGPASLTGRHHPPGQSNRSHALGTLRAARWAWRRVPWQSVRRDPRQRRAFMLAAIFHDIGKTVDRENHEIAGAQIALDTWPTQPLIAYLVLHHSGRWGPAYAPRIAWMVQHGIIEVDTPRNRWLSDLLSSCDYFDAHRHRM